ncbi:amine oxidase [Methylosinus sp. 3S-1]|nr:amine oxidase [Methylosinus sp. 3S-1]
MSFALYEARTRLGGRVLSVEDHSSGLRVDLGPTWFWPDTQPTITGLVAELGLAHFPQHDPGTAMLLAEGDKKPETRMTPNLHSGARRIEGGMATLIEALAKDVPPECIHLGAVLRDAAERGDHVELRFDIAGEPVIVEARRAVLAMPPRLIEEKVAFDPPLDALTRNAMRGAATWMASQAKAVVGFEGKPAWRADGHSGNAFATHEQAVLGEIFDACDASGERAAIGGFFALSIEWREAFEGGMPMLLASQLVQLYGKPLEGVGEQHVQDWVREPFTCATLDKTPPAEHPEYGDPMLRQSFWEGKLLLGGAETAREGGGYVEGALNAAKRIALRILDKKEAPIMIPGTSETTTPEALNESSVARFREWVQSKREPAFASYRQRLNFGLSNGQREQVTQRAMLGAMEAVLKEATAVLETLPFDHSIVAVEKGRSDLTPLVQAAFDGFIQELLDSVIDFNRTSCALSNFPDEHKPSKDYLSATLRDIAAAWREFSLDANQILLDKCASADQQATRSL